MLIPTSQDGWEDLPETQAQCLVSSEHSENVTLFISLSPILPDLALSYSLCLPNKASQSRFLNGMGPSGSHTGAAQPLLPLYAGNPPPTVTLSSPEQVSSSGVLLCLMEMLKLWVEAREFPVPRFISSSYCFYF